MKKIKKLVLTLVGPLAGEGHGQSGAVGDVEGHGYGGVGVAAVPVQLTGQGDLEFFF